MERMELAIISIPLSVAKKKQDQFIPAASRLNFGALAILSYLKTKGIDGRVYDPQHEQQVDQLQTTIEWINKNKPKIIGLSCISGFFI